MVELRASAGISGRRLAESLSWPPSKVSKLENGRQTPTDDDIRDWTRVTGSVAETEALLASLHTLEVQHAEWQRVMRTGLRPRQQALLEWDQRTRLFRAFEATVVPGLLQTAEYARARFAEGIRRLKLPNDINDAVAARVRRQEILYRHADATVFTGLFYRDEIAAYYRASGLPEPYGETARRKIMPETLERRVLTAFDASTPLFRKTSCAVSFVHGLPDYNGHTGIAEICDICPVAQLDICRQAHRIPTIEQLRDAASAIPEGRGLVVLDISDQAAIVSGLDSEQPRYYLQHALGFQIHDVRYPHSTRQHGRASIGWKETGRDD